MHYSKRRRYNILGSHRDSERDSIFASELGHGDLVPVLLGPSVAISALFMAVLATQICRCGTHSRFVFYGFCL